MAVDTSGNTPNPVDVDLEATRPTLRLAEPGMDVDELALHLTDPGPQLTGLTFPHTREALALADRELTLGEQPLFLPEEGLSRGNQRLPLPEALLPLAQPLFLAPTSPAPAEAAPTNPASTSPAPTSPAPEDGDNRAARPPLADYLEARRAAHHDPRVLNEQPLTPSPLIPSQPDPHGQHLRSLEQPPATIGPLRDKHVLLVGINYAPEPTGIAPYTTGMAEHLARQAAGVEVLTGLPHYPHWRVEDRYRGLRRKHEPPRTDDAPGVTRLWHYVPGKQTALTRATYELTFLASTLACGPKQRPDVVIAVTPSLGGAVAGARIARRHGAKLVVVVQDLMAKAAGQSGISGGGAVAGATGRLEGYALRQADRVVIVSESFRPAVQAYGVDDAKIAVLPNWTHITPSQVSLAEARASLGWPPERFVVAHTGNMGLKQDLGNVIEAARLLPDGIDVLLTGDGSQRHALEVQATGLLNLRFIDPLDEVQYPLALAAADVLLVNERPSVGDMSLPSKLTSYLSAGRAILAAVAPDGATAAELARTKGAGLVVRPGDPELLAASIVALHNDEPLRTAMGQAGWRYAHARLDQAAAMLTLDDVVNDLVDDGSPATRPTKLRVTASRNAASAATPR